MNKTTEWAGGGNVYQLGTIITVPGLGQVLVDAVCGAYKVSRHWVYWTKGKGRCGAACSRSDAMKAAEAEL